MPTLICSPNLCAFDSGLAPVYGHWVLVDFACKVVVFVSEFGDFVHDFAMTF